MPDWRRFALSDFEYDFERDELAAHRVTEDHFSAQAKKRGARHHGMADMTDKVSTKRTPRSEEEIDRLVMAQTEDEAAWESAIHRTVKPTALAIPAELAARAAFLARLHRRASVEEWLTHIIEERVELEEAAFVGAKLEMTVRNAR